MRVSAVVRLMVGLSLLLTFPARAAVVYVNKNAPGTVHDGKSWGTAFLTVQAAVNAAASGDEAWVAQGKYLENVSIPASTSVSLFGGFTGTEASRSGRSLGPESTTIDGNANGTVVVIKAPNVTLDGFTVRGGSSVISTGYPWIDFPALQGSGVYCAGDGAVITHNVIRSNDASAGYTYEAPWYATAVGHGGGVACIGNGALVAFNTIAGNSTRGVKFAGLGGTPYSSTNAAGAGVFVAGSDVLLQSNLVIANTIYLKSAGGNQGSAANSTAYGAGIASWGLRSAIRANIIVQNAATALDVDAPSSHGRYPSGSVMGGGIYVQSGIIADNLIAHNRVTGNDASAGAGVYATEVATIINNTIVDNSALLDTTTVLAYGAPVGTNNGGVAAVANSTLANNVVAFNVPDLSLTGVMTSHNDIFGETSTPGATDITSDPLFRDRANGDYRLKIGSPCIDAGDDSVVTPGETDLDGNPRIQGKHVDIGAYETAPLIGPISVQLGTSVSAPPTAIEGVVYIAGEDGKLYAFTSPALSPVTAFPVDISAAVGTAVRLNTRPAVYYGKAGKAIYLTTNLGHVVKVWPDGKIAWFTRPLNGPTMSTPAVTPDGSVYVNLGLGLSSVANYLVKLDEVNGVAEYVSPYLGSSPPSALIDRSAAIDQHYAYVNASGDVLGSLAVLNQDNLTVRASFAPGEDALAPFLNGRNTYVATKAGTVYKVNGITMSPDLAFGTLGAVKMGEAVTAGPFLDATGIVYIGTASGKIWKLDGVTGAKSLFVDSATSSAITGLLVTRTLVVFATANGTLQQVPLGNPSGKSVDTLSGPPAGGPVFDPVQNRFIIATRSGQVYSIPGM